MDSTLLTAARKALRITSQDFDDEIQALIDAAELDIAEVGVDVSALSDRALYDTAVLTYVKANFGLSNPEADRLLQSYEKQLTKLSLLTDHRGED